MCGFISKDFNPRSREGSDGLKSTRIPDKSGFQSTLPRGERRFVAKPATQRIQISIHAPARGATTPAAGMVCPVMNISIHAPARGATYYTVVVGYYANISIHAPARGATLQLDLYNPLRIISIHAPARGATLSLPFSSFITSISIHAPARGATL